MNFARRGNAWVPRLLLAAAATLAASAVAAQSVPALSRFFDATSSDDRVANAALKEIGAAWKPGYAALLLDMARHMRAPRGAPDVAGSSPSPVDDDDDERRPGRGGADTAAMPDRGSPIRRRLLNFLAQQTGRRFGDDLNRWRQWAWALPYDPHPDYAAFKGIVYGQVDPRMRAFFPADARSLIRLDEIDWGGVVVNGIPPLRQPPVVAAAAADYLKDGHVVFGMSLNGEARAYPKRILAWHEMAIDRVGGVDLTIVYCTLCGTVIPFESQVAGRRFRFGTSGLLYRSNKLMFDEDTNSLWSTFEGTPVVGALVGSGIRLTTRPVVTTTWKEWRTAHPNTTVLSINTGFKRDYSEGAAYRDYFASDRLMFEVSQRDSRLANKAEVLVLQAGDPASTGARVPVAIDVRLLRSRPVYTFQAAGLDFVAVTTPQGANRVYRTSVSFPNQRADATILDREMRRWRVTEEGLVLEGAAAATAPRVSAQRAFWFGWYAQFPETVLFK